MPFANCFYIPKRIALLAILAVFATNNAYAEPCQVESQLATVCPDVVVFPDDVTWNDFPTVMSNGNPVVQAGCYYVVSTGNPNFAGLTNSEWKINGTNMTFTWAGDIPSAIDEGYYIYVGKANTTLYGLSTIMPGTSANKPDCAKGEPFSGSASIVANNPPRIGETLTISASSNAGDGTLNYSWIATSAVGQEQPVGSSSSYLVTIDDLGKTIRVEIREDGRSGVINAGPTAVVAKKASLSPPGAPTLLSKTHNRVTLTPTAGYQYSNDNGSTWQNSNVFSGLDDDTEYTFYQRIGETNDTEASLKSAGLTERTNIIDPNALLGTAIIDNTSPKIYDELTASFDTKEIGDLDLTYTWFVGGEEVGTGTTYTVQPEDFGKTIKVEVISSVKYANEVESEPTNPVVKIPQETPTALQLSDIVDKSHNYITIDGSSEYNYGFGIGGAAPDWSSQGYTISGLSKNTAYNIYRRLAETETQAASDQSPPLSVTTEGLNEYWITGGANNFGVKDNPNSNSFINPNGEANKLMNDPTAGRSIIPWIRDNASGSNVSITFGVNGNTVNFDRENPARNTPIVFDGNWGKITLGGKINLSNNQNTSDNFIEVGTDRSLTSNIAEVSGTFGAFILVKGSGNVTIANGTINNGANKGIATENSGNTGTIVITGGNFTGTGLAVENLSSNVGIVLGGSPTITGAIKTTGNNPITLRPGFNPNGNVKLQFTSANAGEIAVTNGAALAGKFTLESTPNLKLSPINEHLYLCTTTGTEIDGDASIDKPSPRIGDVLTASISNSNAGLLLSYVWKANGTLIPGATGNTYTVQVGDFEKTITVEISSCDKAGFVSATTAAAVLKKQNSHQTVTPTADPGNITYNSITLDAISGYEYSMDGTNWQDSPIFSELNEGASYTFYQRQKATEDTEASQNAIASIQTGTAPDGILKGTVIISYDGELRVGTELTAEFNNTNTTAAEDVEYEWKADGNVVQSASSTATYTVVFGDLGKTITVTVTASNKTNDVSSQPTATVQKAILTGTATISFNDSEYDAPQIGTNSAQLTASIVGGNNTGTPTYVWKANGVTVGTNSSTYTVNANDVAKRITVTISTTDQEDVLTSDPTLPVRNANGEAFIAYYLVSSGNNGANFKATRGSINGSVVNDGAVQTTIEAVRSDAGGADVEINFGDGSNEEILNGNIIFANAGGSTWGKITIKGNFKSRMDGSVITIGSGVSAISTITNTFEWTGPSVIFTNEGSLTISGGTILGIVNNNTINSIVNTGTLTLSGNPTIGGRINTQTGGVGVDNLNGSGYILQFTDVGNGKIAVLNGKTADIGKFNVSTNHSGYSLIFGGINLRLYLNGNRTCDDGYEWANNQCEGKFDGSVAISGGSTPPQFGEQLTAVYTGDISPVIYTWKRYSSDGTTFIEDIPNSNQDTYTLAEGDIGKTIAVDVTANGYAGHRESNKTGIVVKADYAGDPAVAPEEASKTHISITLATISGYEYRIDDGSGNYPTPPTNVFTGLDPDKEYTFYQRVAATTTTEASDESAPATIRTTKIPLIGTATIDGNIEDTRVGDILKAEFDGDSDDDFVYQWQANGVDIVDDADTDTYVVTEDDWGKVITVVISAGTNSTYYGTKESDPTAAVKYIDIGTASIASNGVDVDDPRIGDQLTASLDKAGATGVAYVWKKDGVAIENAILATYTLVVADDEALISVEITATNRYGTAIKPLSKEVEKKDNPNTPAAPTLSLATDNSITLNAITDGEYSIDGGDTWQPGVEFDELTRNKPYSFVQRIKANSDTYASDWSNPKEIYTLKTDLAGTAAISGNTDDTRVDDVLEAIFDGESDGKLAYQWYAGSDPIDDATESTYKVTEDDHGEVITVVISAAGDSDYQGSTNASDATEAVKYLNIGTASIASSSGDVDDPRIHDVLTASLDDDGADDVTYVWKRDGVVIPNEIGETYTLAVADDDKIISVVISATNRYGDATETLSKKVDKMDNPTIPAAPTLSLATDNSIKLAQKLGYQFSIDGGNWTTDSLFTNLDRNKTYSFRQRIEATSTHHASNPSAPVSFKTLKTDLDGTVTISTSGTLNDTRVDDVLEAIFDGENDGRLAYQWYTDSDPIDGATESTYKVTEDDHGAVITVEITAAEDSDYQGTIPSTDETSAVEWLAIGTASIASNGEDVDDPRVGDMLTASLDDAGAKGVAYVWNRDGSPINNETGKTYTLAVADIGKTISVKITATNRDGSAPATLSKSVEKKPAPEVVAPALADRTDTEIILVAIDGYEYSNDNGTSWQSSSTFNGLSHNAPYNFIQKFVGTADTYASDESDPVEFRTLKTTLTGTATITYNTPLRIGDELEAVFTNGNTSDLEYQWKADGVDIVDANDDTYRVTLNDRDKTITVVISAAGNSNYTGTKESTPTSVVLRKVNPTTTVAVDIDTDDITHNSVILAATNDYEYSKDDGATWQPSNEFTHLTAETEYIFCQRVAQDDEFEASEKECAVVSTLAAPILPFDGEITITGYTGYPRVGDVLSVDLTESDIENVGEISYEWFVNGISKSFEASYMVSTADIGFAIRAVIEATNRSDELEATTPAAQKKDAPAAPAKPTVADKTSTSITLAVLIGGEYSKDGGTTWQSNPAFSDLNPNADYSFVQRIAETNDTKASGTSEVLQVKTDPSTPTCEDGYELVDGQCQLTPIGKPNLANTNIGISVSGGNLHVYTPKSVQVRIFDLKGKELLNRTIAPNETVSIAHLPKGIYMVNVGKETFKMVK